MKQFKPSFLSLLFFFLPFGVSFSFSPGAFLKPFTAAPAVGTENGLDDEYPWYFAGRLWFRPALVRIPSRSNDDNNNDPNPPFMLSSVNLFGWTIGGTVALEYDESPVGPYLEYVTMGSLVRKGGAFGQWGARLYVSTKEAEQVCQDIWNVPAELADITFVDDDDNDNGKLFVESVPDKFATAQQKISVRGWSNTRVLPSSSYAEGAPKRRGGLPVLWTPSIKALWAPVIIPFPGSGKNDDEENNLPLHRLRLSASALRLTLCDQSPSDTLGIPLGVGLVVDNVLIEISRQDGTL